MFLARFLTRCLPHLPVHLVARQPQNAISTPQIFAIETVTAIPLMFVFFARFLTMCLPVFGRTKYALFRERRPFPHPGRAPDVSAWGTNVTHRQGRTQATKTRAAWKSTLSTFSTRQLVSLSHSTVPRRSRFPYPPTPGPASTE